MNDLDILLEPIDSLVAELYDMHPKTVLRLLQLRPKEVLEVVRVQSQDDHTWSGRALASSAAFRWGFLQVFKLACRLEARRLNHERTRPKS